MARSILSVSYFQDTYQFVEINKQSGGYFVQASMPNQTREAVLAACKRADEIYVNAELPSALYRWEVMPKVAKRYQGNMVSQAARERVGADTPIHVQWKPVADVVEGGASKTRIMFVAVQGEDLKPLWDTFGRFIKKVKRISPLPLALTSTIAAREKPESNFFVVWVGPEASVIAIGSSDGLVKMARTVPVGLSDSPDDFSGDPSVFSENLSKELFMTSSFFKQEFREGVPGSIYFLGSDRTEAVLGEHPLTGAPADIHYFLTESPVKGVPDSQANALMNLIGNLDLPEQFSFLPAAAVAATRADVTFRLAAAALVVAILASGVWGVSLYNRRLDRIAEMDRQATELKKVQTQVQALRADVSRLLPFEGWKQLYQAAFQNRPGWNMVFSELGLLVPDDVLIEEFMLETLSKETLTGAYVARLSGKVRAENWQAGLDVIRDFGESLQASPLYDVVNVKYSPEKLGEATRIFDFQMTVKLLPRGAAHES